MSGRTSARIVHQVAVGILSAVLAMGCDGPHPTPAPVVRGGSALPSSVTVRVAGSVVDGGDEPVPGAELTFQNAAAATRTIATDESGAYSATVELHTRWTGVTVWKPGYELSRYWMQLDPAQVTTRDFRLHQVRVMAAGESVHFSIHLDDSGCGMDLYICRRIRVTSSSEGVLTLEVLPDRAGMQLGIVEGNKEPWPSSSSLTVQVVAGSEKPFDIILFRSDGEGPQWVTLKTRLEHR